MSLITRPDPQTFQEVCDSLRDMEEEASGCIQTIKQKGKDLILLRFRQGYVAHRALEMRENTYGKEVVKTLAQRAGMHRSTLYRAIQFAEHPQFNLSEARLRRWMDEVEEEKGRISWTYCRSWVKKYLPEEEGEAEETLRNEMKKLDRRSQKLEQDAEDLRREVERRKDAGQDVTLEALGTSHKAKEVAEDMRRQAERFEVKGQGRITSEKYLDHVRSYACFVCSNESVDAHHISSGGMGTKGPDFFTVPLCREHHGELHQIGAHNFQEKHGLQLWAAVALLLVEFFTPFNLSG